MDEITPTEWLQIKIDQMEMEKEHAHLDQNIPAIDFLEEMILQFRMAIVKVNQDKITCPYCEKEFSVIGFNLHKKIHLKTA